MTGINDMTLTFKWPNSSELSDRDVHILIPVSEGTIVDCEYVSLLTLKYPKVMEALRQINIPDDVAAIAREGIFFVTVPDLMKGAVFGALDHILQRIYPLVIMPLPQDEEAKVRMMTILNRTKVDVSYYLIDVRSN